MDNKIIENKIVENKLLENKLLENNLLENNIQNNDIYELKDNNTNTTKLKIIKGDAIEKLDMVENKSIQTICIDPPYNIGKDTWDSWENNDKYIEWLMKIIIKLEKKLKDNGSFFIFHNDMEQISEIMQQIKTMTKLKFKQMIVWNKRFDGCKKRGYLNGFLEIGDAHNWLKMAEYILFYTFDNSEKLIKIRKEKKIRQTIIAQEIKSKNNKPTGWYNNIEAGKSMPTRENMVAITKFLGVTYDDIVPKFNNMKTHHSVWNYNIMGRTKIHITPKPVDLLENIIYHTTDEGDTLLDCFAGTGSLGIACLNTKRKCILIEKNEEYYNYFVNVITNTNTNTNTN